MTALVGVTDGGRGEAEYGTDGLQNEARIEGHIQRPAEPKSSFKDRTGTLYYTFPVALFSGAQPNSPFGRLSQRDLG